MSLAFLIYLAGVSGNVGTILAIFGILGLIIVMVGVLFCAMIRIDAYGDEALRKNTKQVQLLLKQLRWIIPSLLIASLLPSEQRVYMMAAAEIGTDVLETPEAAKLRRLINEKLDGALGDEAAQAD